MSIRRVTILYVLAFLLQLSVINLFAVHGIAPNLLLCLTVFCTFRFDKGYRTLPFALVFQMLNDICVGTYAGVGSMCIFIIWVLVVWFKYYMNTKLLKTLLVTGAFATVIYGILYWVFMSILQQNYSLGYVLLLQIGYVIFNAIVMAVLWFFYSSIFENWKLRHTETDEEN